MHLPGRPYLSISNRITLSITLVPAALMSIFGILSVDEERLALQSILHKQGNGMAQSIASYSVEAIISEDYPALDKVLQTIGRESDNIVLIEVSKNERVIARYGHMSPDNVLVSKARVMLRNTAMPEYQLGEVKLLISERDNEAIIAARVKSMVFNMFFAFTLLILSLRYMLNELVVKRIRNLKRLTEQVIATELPDELSPDPSADVFRDEIDVLQKRFSTMLEGLQSRDHARISMLTEIDAARALMEDVANTMRSSLIVVAQDGTISFCNRTALAATENPTQPVVGQPLRAAFPYSDEDTDIILNMVRHHQAVSRLPIRKLIDEQLHFFEVAVYPLSSAASEGAVIRVDDVTERTRMQETMMQTDKMASVGGLAAGVAHEINNPLGVMVQAAQNIERRLSEKLAANHRVAEECGTTIGTIRAYLEKRNILEFLEDIKSDGARASKIVRNLLEFSHRNESAREPVLMEELFLQSLELAQKDYDLKKHTDFRQIRISIEVDPALPPVSMVRSQIEQVLLNLLKNSAQALTDKITSSAASGSAFTPEITLRAQLEADHVRIEIQDNGPGFTAETRRRAFEPFFTTKPPGSGTGLGLWISYAIVIEKHGGEIILDSAPDKGCKIILNLPFEGEKGS
ncbi:MAG: ATP-binding protein [Gallionella sp.]|nr:ATP-binding protein [Gallionella sp.]